MSTTALHIPRSTPLERLRAHVLDHKVATCWDELQPAQFVAIVRALRSSDGMANLLVRIANELLCLGWRHPRRTAAWFFGFTAEERHRLTVSLAAPFVDPKVKMTETLLRTLHCGSQLLHVCDPDLLNHADAYEFGYADTLFMKFNASGNMDMLRGMALVLYAPTGMSERDRKRGAHLKLQMSLREDELLALHLNWAGIRQVWVRENPHVFTSKTEKKVLRKQAGWPDVLRSLSGGKFGDYDTTGMAPARIFLNELNDRIKAAKDLEAEREKLKLKHRRH